MITFDTIPADIRTPIVAVEFDGSAAQAQSGAQPYSVLVVGQKLASGTQDALVPVRVTRIEQARALFGEGSMLAGMARALFDQSEAIESVFIALDDPVGGTKAAGTVTFTAASPNAGRIALYVGARRYSVTSTASSTATSLASSLVELVNADRSAYVTAAAVAGVVTLTAKHAGGAAGAIDLRPSYYDDETLPDGVGVEIAAFSGGAGDVDLATVVAALPDEQYNVLAVPYTDSASLGVIEAELADRNKGTKSIDGLAVAPSAAPFADLATLGDSRNSEHLIIPAATGSPSPVWEWAAALAMVVAFEGQLDPARPFQTVPLNGIRAPQLKDRMIRSERDLLLRDGVSTTVATRAGTIVIERLITSYQENSQGIEDTAYLDVTTLLTLSLQRYDIRSLFSGKYGRHKLADNGTQAAAGSSVITPKLATAEVINLARRWEARGIVENVDAWKDGIFAERDAEDPNRLNIFLPPNLTNGLIVTAAKIGFRE